MLVLTRKLRESIKIGDDITVIVLDIDGGRIQLGIQCPRHINIRRSELPPQDIERDSEEANCNGR